MKDSVALDILKNAILLERRGKAFYTKVAEQTSSEAARQFFQMMADEEDSHIKILSDQFKAYMENNKFGLEKPAYTPSGSFSAKVLTDEMKKQISAADFEAAAVAAAMNMEKKAITLYSERSETASDEEEKAVYQWLVDWEKTHLQLLSEIDREVTEKIWNDNSFWPF